MTLKQARAMAGTTTWASHSREQVDTALAIVTRALDGAEADLAAARAELETAYKEGHRRGNRYIVGMAFLSEREDDWLAWQARKGLTP
jgi:hypothetical protein